MQGTAGERASRLHLQIYIKYELVLASKCNRDDAIVFHYERTVFVVLKASQARDKGKL